MRMGPFSNNQIIKYLNSHFVPVYVSNEEYRAGQFGKKNLQLLQELYATAEKKKLPVGTVHVYLLTPDVDLVTSMHVMHAMKPEVLVRLLTSTARELKTPYGDTLVEPRKQLPIPEVASDELLLRNSSQYLDRQGIVGEDMIVLSKSDWQQFTGPPKSSPDLKGSPGSLDGPDSLSSPNEWKISDDLAKKILIHFYPYSQDWDESHDQISRADMEAYYLPTSEKENYKREIVIRGQLEMTHNSQPGRDPLRVSAEIVGMVKLPANAKNKPDITLTTGIAFYGSRRFECLIRTIDPSLPTNEAATAETSVGPDESEDPDVTGEVDLRTRATGVPAK